MASPDSPAQSTGQFMREVFRKHYDKLSMVRLEILAPSLVTGNVITSDDHESIREFKNTSDKSAVILRAIASHLDVDCTESFTLLLDHMDQLGDIAIKKLAGEINQELNRSSRREANENSDNQPKQRQQIDFSKCSVDEAFSVLSAGIYHIFVSHNVEFEVLRRTCIENVNTPFGACIPQELVDEIKDTANLNNLFDVLASSPYWSWINIRILTKMVRVSRVDEAEELVERYKEAVFSRKLGLLLKQIPALNIPADYYAEVEQKWNKSLDEVTVQDLVSHWSKMEELFDVKEPTLLLKKVVDGCVEIHWLVPANLTHQICCAVFNGRHSNKSILHLKISNHVILRNEITEGLIDSRSTSVSKDDGELIQSSLVQQLSSSHSIKPSLVEQVFDSLVEFIITKSSSLEHCVDQCKSLMASDAQKIRLFSDVQLRELDKYCDNSSLLQGLKFLWSWSDHSILATLASSCDDVVKLLTQFNDHLDHSQLLSAYPIACVSPTIAPSDASPYTVVAIKSDLLIYHCTLQYVYDVRALLMKACQITAHCLQLVAARADPAVLYWRIPKCVVNLVITKVLEYHKAFHDELITEVCVHPFVRISTSSGRVLGSLVYLLPSVPPDNHIETAGSEVLESTKLITKWLSKPEDLFDVFDKLITDIRNKDEDIFQLRNDHRQISRMFQHVIQQNRQLQGDNRALKKEINEYKQLYEKKAQDFNEVLIKNEQQIKELKKHLPETLSTDKMELEDAMKKLQLSLGEFRSCFEEISLYRVSVESSDKDISVERQKDSKEFSDLTSVKLSHISQEIMDWTVEMKQYFDLQKTLKEKLQETEAKAIQLDVEMERLTSDTKSKDEVLQHAVQQIGRLHRNLSDLQSDLIKHKELYMKKAKDFDEFMMTKKEQLRKALEQPLVTHSADKLEDAVKKLQTVWDDLRLCFQGIPSYKTRTESDDKELAIRQLKDISDSMSTKLSIISQEIVETKDWTNEMKKQNFELKKALKEKSREAEERNVKLKQLEAEITVEELKKPKKLQLKKLEDLKSDVKKPENIQFGTGRYGETYKMNVKGTWCTVKLLHKTLLSSGQSHEHLIAKVTKQCNTLHHPNLVTFIGMTEVDKRPAIMTELMEVNLFTYIEQNSDLTLDTEVSLCKDMSRGLQELHSHSLLHNNLHNCNVLIQDNRAKISDYYYPLLQIKGQTPGITEVTPFLAPEVTEDQSNFSQSSDIYSLAVLFLNVVTGKAPVVQEHKQNIAAVPHILLPLIQQCLSDKTAGRPSAAQICDEIKAAQDSPQYVSLKALKQKDPVPLFQAVKGGNKRLEWRTCATLPAPLIGANAVVLENIIYVSGGEGPDEFASRYVFAYHFLENKWTSLPALTHSHGVPAVVSNQLVIIGGKDIKSKKLTNQVSTYNQNEHKWESVYPNLGKERYAPLAVTYKHYVIVAGGKYHTIVVDRLYDDIEVLNVQDADKLVWIKVPTRLPAKMWSPSATISNDQLWIVGFNNDNSGSLNLIEQRSDEVFRIPAADIVATDKKGKWESLPRVMPYYSSTVVPNSNPIVTIGGDTRDTRPTNAVEMFDSVNIQWQQVAYLEAPSRAYVAVACIGEQQAIVVLGGCTETKNKKARNDSSLALVQIGYAV